MAGMSVTNKVGATVPDRNYTNIKEVVSVSSITNHFLLED